MFGYSLAGFGSGRRMGDTLTKIINANARGCVGDGETDNSGPLIRMRDYMRRNSWRTYHIYFEPGRYIYDNNKWLGGVDKFILDAYGCTFQCTRDEAGYGPSVPLNIGDIFNDKGDSNINNLISGDRFHSAAAGDMTITMVSPGVESDYTPGERVLVYGYDQQFEGYPPNARYFEFKVIESVGAGVITFADPLTQLYDDRWPDSVSASNPAFGAPRILTLDEPHRIQSLASFIYIRGASFLANPVRPQYSSLATPAWTVIYEDVNAVKLAPTQSKDVIFNRVRATFGGYHDKIVDFNSNTDCIFKGNPHVSMNGATSFNKMIFDRTTFYGTLNISPRHYGIRDCVVHPNPGDKYGVIGLNGLYPVRVLDVRGMTTYNLTPDTLGYVVNPGVTQSLTVGSASGTDIHIPWGTDAKRIARSLDYNKRITKTDGSDSGVVTGIYRDGSGDLVIQGTWSNPAPGDEYEFQLIDQQYDGGGNHIVGEQVPMWRYPAAVNS